MTALYLIEVSHPQGAYFPERNTADLTREATIRDIRDGQFDGANRILCLSDNGTWADATVEIAQAILDDLDQEPHWDLQNFLENALGCRAVADWYREMELVA